MSLTRRRRHSRRRRPLPYKKVGHEAVVAFEVGEDGAGFGAGEDDGEFRRAGDAFDAGDEFEFPLEDLLVEEEEGAEGLVLGGGGDAAVDGEVAQEGGDFFFAEVGGVALSVEEDKAADPVGVSGLRCGCCNA